MDNLLLMIWIDWSRNGQRLTNSGPVIGVLMTIQCLRGRASPAEVNTEHRAARQWGRADGGWHIRYILVIPTCVGRICRLEIP